MFRMAPVEHDSLPASEVVLKPFSDMKMVEKALELPLVSDTLSELGRVTHSLRLGVIHL